MSKKRTYKANTASVFGTLHCLERHSEKEQPREEEDKATARAETTEEDAYTLDDLGNNWY